ncbi:RNA-directed DNA polymerase [Sphaerospermopsis aphanizomenoides BCCUSP55]|uniref:RNA-directed DNA polymerase n=1 Tax=Sphaerospermopsis aphanizomenoides TaxID=459663 RepID=UPI0019037D42|nr:RNA-directed DNA polymerase [Sphaerospermopsis aphanizomenoides]MBK1990217.1 RNA-directed DNA polymerase [Sphaerospermopsis aphanizomenoides BCCUSP55]
MKRYDNLWHQIINWEKLMLAARYAQKGKRFRPNVLEFNYNLEQELFKLQSELENLTYHPGKYNTFYIYDPKPRLISAAPYRDRVVHHALCNIIIPLIEKSFINDTYANRLGYGTHRALKKFTKFARSSRYVLQCDVRKYFPSIDHEILKNIIRCKIKCRQTLWLIELIIDNSNSQENVIEYFPGDDLLTPIMRPHGLPIGNLTSQFFANFYLNYFDHFVKEELRAKKYLRYVDDFAIFSDDYDFLVTAKTEIEKYLASLRLKMHPIKSQLLETCYGANFVGFRVLPDRVRVRNDNLRRGRLRLNKLQKDVAQDKISPDKIMNSLQSWEAHLKHGNTYRLRRSIFNHYSILKLTF